VQEIQNHIGGYKDRCAVVVTGTRSQERRLRASARPALVICSYRHICDESAGSPTGSTIATGFNTPTTWTRTAGSVIEDMDKSCWSCAHDQCIDLVNLAIEKGSAPVSLSTEYSFLINSPSHHSKCLQTKGNSRQVSVSDDGLTMTGRDLELSGGSTGRDLDWKICFVHVSIYNRKSTTDLVQDITRSHTSFSVPIVEVGEVSLDGTSNRDPWDMEVEDSGSKLTQRLPATVLDIS
jgi:hypothetical protein